LLTKPDARKISVPKARSRKIGQDCAYFIDGHIEVLRKALPDNHLFIASSFEASAIATCRFGLARSLDAVEVVVRHLA